MCCLERKTVGTVQNETLQQYTFHIKKIMWIGELEMKHYIRK